MRSSLLICALLLFGCEDYPQYYISSESSIPDSLKNDHAKFVIEATRAASFHMTGGDYEDPEDVMNAASLIFQSIYSVEKDGLKTVACHGCYSTFTPENELTPTQRKIYNSLTNK